MTEAEADRFLEGWRTGHRAAIFALRVAEGEFTSAAQRTAVAEAASRVDAIDRPAPRHVPARALRLEAAIRAAIALGREEFGPEAVAVLEDALK